MAEGELRILDGLKGKVEDYPEVHLHVGTASVLARVAMLETTQMTAGQKQMVQLRFAEPLVLVPGERFVIRTNLAAQGQSGLTTVGGGRILSASNVRLRRQKQWTLDLLRARLEALDNPKSWCELMLREAAQPLSSTELQKRCFIGPEEFSKALQELRGSGTLVDTESGLLVHRTVIDSTAAKMLEGVESFHKANTQRAGLDQAALFAAAGGSVEICGLAVKSLLSARKLECVGAVFSRFGWSTRISDRDQRLYDGRCRRGEGNDAEPY
jgi:selenocysteine-specific elongation factor